MVVLVVMCEKQFLFEKKTKQQLNYLTEIDNITTVKPG